MAYSNATRFTTADQKFYRDGKRFMAEIEVEVTDERIDEYPEIPPIAQCRHAALEVRTTDTRGESTSAYVTYDRLLCRIVNGAYACLEDALLSAQSYNERASAPQDMAPNGLALGLRYPEVRKEKSIRLAIADKRQEG